LPLHATGNRALRSLPNYNRFIEHFDVSLPFGQTWVRSHGVVQELVPSASRLAEFTQVDFEYRKREMALLNLLSSALACPFHLLLSKLHKFYLEDI
jgi:hypothetical protein